MAKEAHSIADGPLTRHVPGIPEERNGRAIHPINTRAENDATGADEFEFTCPCLIYMYSVPKQT